MRAIADFAPGDIFVISEKMGDSNSTTIEVRETYYIRDDDAPCRFPNNVRAARLATIQGVIGDENVIEPRYKSVLSEPCRDLGEIDGRVKAEGYHPGHVWKMIALPAIERAKLERSALNAEKNPVTDPTEKDR